MTTSAVEDDADVHTALLLGDRYELGPLIGRGGMADVFRARDLITGGDVAVKLFRPGLDLAESRRRRHRELTMLRSLEHEGLVSVLDVEAGDGPTSEALYLVVELVEGPTLRERLAEQPLDDHDVGSLGATLCDAVAYMHRQGVVHRDLKPANVLLGRHHTWSQAKLTDFGIARMIDSTRMTADGLLVGTANYLSPEQVQGSEVGLPSDVYSLGLLLIECVTSAVVFPGHGVEAALARLHRQPQIPSRINPRLADLLRRMTAHDPAHRPTAEQAGAELAAIADPSLISEVLALGPDVDDLPTRVITVRPRRQRTLVTVAFALITAAAAVSTWAVVSHRPDAGQASAPGRTTTSTTPQPIPTPTPSPTPTSLGAAGHVAPQEHVARATVTPSRSRSAATTHQSRISATAEHATSPGHRDVQAPGRHPASRHRARRHAPSPHAPGKANKPPASRTPIPHRPLPTKTQGDSPKKPGGSAAP